MIVNATYQPRRKPTQAALNTQVAGYTVGLDYDLRVRSNLLGALQHKLHFLKFFAQQQSISIEHVWHSDKQVEYQTVSQFLDTWKINWSAIRIIRVPFLRKEVGGGEAFRAVAELFPLRVKLLFDGCEDRRQWFNWSVKFVPWGWKSI